MLWFLCDFFHLLLLLCRIVYITRTDCNPSLILVCVFLFVNSLHSIFAPMCGRRFPCYATLQKHLSYILYSIFYIQRSCSVLYGIPCFCLVVATNVLFFISTTTTTKTKSNSMEMDSYALPDLLQKMPSKFTFGFCCKTWTTQTVCPSDLQRMP